MIVTRFKDKDSENVLYFSIDLYLKLQEKIQLANSLGTNISVRWIRHAIASIKRNQNVQDYCDFFGPVQMTVISELEKIFDLKIFIWRRNNGKSLEKVWETQKPAADGRQVNLLSDTFDKYTIGDLSKLALIVKMDSITINNDPMEVNGPPQITTMNFWEAVVRDLHPKYFGEKFHQKVSEYKLLWGKNALYIHEVKQFYKQFGIGIQIWRITKSGHKKITKLDRVRKE